jgi:hypothetical protein
MTTPLSWRKRGLLFQPDASLAWSRSHAAVPTPLHLHGGVYRVFYSGRDDRNRSHVGSFDIDLEAPDRVLAAARTPVLEPGPPGRFDGDGVYVESAVRMGDRIRLYTVGVTTGQTRPLFYAAIGLAEGDVDTMARRSVAPILDRSEWDPCLVTAPFVLVDDGRWRMWYVSGVSWSTEPYGLQSRYHVKYAESDDGVSWRRTGQVCLDFATPDETNIARLWVVRDGGRYRGWYSANAGQRGYRLGYAESADGLTWTRLDHLVGIGLSESGWDSQAMAYPAVVRHAGHWFMFYNGNAFGRDGIGLAIAPA